MLGVVINPHARGARRDPALLERVATQLDAGDDVAAPTTPEALRAQLGAWRARGLSTLAVYGGDGTGHRVVSEVMRAWPEELPEVLWLTGGTMNTVSRSMGQRGSPQGQLAAFLAARRSGQRLARTRRWPLRVDGEQHGFLFGVGIVQRFIEVYEDGPQPSPLKAAWTLARAVASAFVGGPFAERFFRGVPLRVRADDHAWPERAWRILTVGAVDQIGLGFAPTPGVLTAPGRMEVYASAASPIAFARSLPALFRGGGGHGPDDARQTCARLVLEGDGPIAYNLDGDLSVGGATVVVETTRPVTFLLAPGARPPPNTLGP